jgi:hypothetical protein
MNILGALLESISISFQDSKWIQTLDYEYIPFKCCKFHEHGHLFRDFPHNVETTQAQAKNGIDMKGFTKVPSKRQPGKNPTKPTLANQGKETNNFQILALLVKVEPQTREPLRDNKEKDHKSNSPKEDPKLRKTKVQDLIQDKRNRDPEDLDMDTEEEMHLDLEENTQYDMDLE